MSLTHLKEQLDALSVTAKKIDAQQGKSRTPLFDERLFSCLSHYLAPCVSEAKKRVEELEKEQQSASLSSLRATHLCEKLINQISALQREIATLSLRQQEKYFRPKSGLSMAQLYTSLSQHQEWERRLENSRKKAEDALKYSTSFYEHQKQLIITEQRLSRCREARKKIEANIAYKERKRYEGK